MVTDDILFFLFSAKIRFDSSYESSAGQMGQTIHINCQTLFLLEKKKQHTHTHKKNIARQTIHMRQALFCLEKV